MQKKILITVILLAMSHQSNAQASTLLENELLNVTENTRLYYQLGGSRPISPPPSTPTNLRLGGNVRVGLGYSCGKFDPTIGLRNFFTNIENGIDDAMNTVVQAATSAITSLPALIVSRNSPDLYELVQTNVFRAEKKWSINSKSCEALESEIAQGKNPFKEWLPEASATMLAEEAESNPDINQAMEDVATDSGDGGINFPVADRGIIKAGGRDQPHIQPLTSAIITGYNTQIERTDMTSTLAPTSTIALQTPIVRTFESPAHMVAWTREVMGEQDKATSAHENPNSTAGRGLLAVASDQEVEVRDLLTNIVANPRGATPEELSGIYTQNLLLTDEVLDGIRKSSYKNLLIDRFSGEIALNQEIEKALMVRRTLLVGMVEKNIAASGAAQTEIQLKIDQIEKEIDRAMFEYRLKKELVSNLASHVLDVQSGNSRQEADPDRDENIQFESVTQ